MSLDPVATAINKFADKLRAAQKARLADPNLPQWRRKALEAAVRSKPTHEPVEPAKRTRNRKPTLAGVAKQTAKASIPVAAYEVRPDGTIGVVVGTPNEAKPDSDNPWDKVLRNAPH
jgi:hypothetical protein